MSKVDPAGALAKLLEAAIKKQLSMTNVALPCRVLSFDPASGMATVQPLLQLTDNPPAPIQKVPALGHKVRTEEGTEMTLRPVLQQGDVVYIVCADRQLGGAAEGSMSKPATARNHDKNDAVIVGVFPCSLPSS